MLKGRWLGIAVAALLAFAAPALAAQNTLVTPSAPLTMAGLATFLNNALTTIGTNFSGPTAPAVCTGAAVCSKQWWVDTSTSPQVYKVYDGAQWVPVFTLDTSTHVATAYGISNPSTWLDGWCSSTTGLSIFRGASTWGCRAIIGPDLPVPSTTTQGGIFSLPVTSNSVLSGIANDGTPTRATTTGTGNVVRATGGALSSPTIDTPTFTGSAFFNGSSNGYASVQAAAAAGTSSWTIPTDGGTPQNFVGDQKAQILGFKTLADPTVTGSIFLNGSGTGYATLQAAATAGASSWTFPLAAAPQVVIGDTLNQAISGKASYNNVVITAPASAAVLTLGSGKTFTASNTMTLTSNDASTIAFGAGGTVAYTAGASIPTIAQGDTLYGSAANTLVALAKDTNATRALCNTGTSNNPAWCQVSLITGVQGTLQAAQEPAHTGDVTNSAGSLALTLATAQPAVHTWALAQTFTVAPVFTDASGSRTALGLGTAATQNTGTSGANLPFANGTNTWASTQTFTLAPVFTDASGSRTALGLGTSATVNTGTSGATVPLLNGANTWAAGQTFSAALTYGGVTLSNSVSGTGSMALTAAPTFTGNTHLAGFVLDDNTGLYTTDATISKYGSANYVYINGTALGGIQLRGDGAAKQYILVAGGTGTITAYTNNTLALTLDTAQNATVAGTFSATLAQTTQLNMLCYNATSKLFTYSTIAQQCTVSSEEYKEGIETMSTEQALAEVVAMRPVSFVYKQKMGLGRDRHAGLLAGEVAKVAPHLAIYKDSKPEAIKQAELPFTMIGAIQQLNARIDELRAELAKAKAAQ